METLQQLQRHLPLFALALIRLCLWLLLLMVIFIPLERLCARHPQKIFRQGFLTDLGYYFLNSVLSKLLLVLPLSMIAIGVHYLAPDRLHAWVGEMPAWLRCAMAVLVGELGAYWGHRWSHEVPLLWRFHCVHHSAQAMDWLVNTRAHPLDLVFIRFCGLFPLYVLGLAQPSDNSVDWLPLLYAIVGTVWGFFIHANVRWRFGWLEWCVSTPAFHHWHHTQDGPHPRNKNYAALLPLLDRMFGTFHLPRRQWPMTYGIPTSMAPGLQRQLLQPFERR